MKRVYFIGEMDLECSYLTSILLITEATTGGVLQKKVFLRILQNSQKNTCAGASFLIKLQAETCNFI